MKNNNNGIKKNGSISGGQDVFKGRTVLIVNTGSLKKKFILQKLKKLDLTVVVLHKEKNWAQPYVDHWILADTANHNESLQAVKEFLQKNQEIRIDGALTFWEDDVLLTSKIAEKLDLPGIPFRIAKQIRNKYLFREFCEKNGILAPKFRLVRNEKDLAAIKSDLRFPIVLKPAYGSSSAFVVTVESPDELDRLYRYVLNNISVNVESALSDGLDIFVEEFIDGDEVDVDIILQNGKVKFASVADNYNKSKGIFFVDSGQAVPSGLPDDVQEKILDTAEIILERFGVENGCIHFEAKHSSKGGVYPIEMNIRMGGDYVYSYTKGVWNIDLIELAVKIAIGSYFPKVKKAAPRKYIIGWDLHPEESGVLVELDVPEELKRLRHVEDIQIYKEVGDAVLLPPEGYEYIGWLTVSGENMLDAKDNLDDVLRRISFSVVKFDPASSIGKTERKNRFSAAVLNKNFFFKKAKIEAIRRMDIKDQRTLHIGIAGNTYSNEGSAVELDLMSVGTNIERTLRERGYQTTFFDFSNIEKAFGDLKKSDVNLVFNVCERINDSSLLEPHAASLLDILQIPYTGSNPFTLSLCIDKIRVKKLLTYHNIPTPQWDYAYSLDEPLDETLKYPLIVKPANTDNSIGITDDSVVTNKKELRRQLEHVIKVIGSPALIEEYISGDEYDVSIIGSEEDDLRVLPLSRSIFKNMPQDKWHIYTHEMKFGEEVTPESRGIVVERPVKGIGRRQEALLSEIALDTYNILDCHDYGRIEIKVDENDNPYVLELNPNPSINIGDCVPNVAKLTGMDYGDFLEEIIRLTIKRYKNREPYHHLQTNLM